MDTLFPEKRSWNMSRIKDRDTKPEMVIRSLLHRMGYRFRLHRKDLPGKPDIVLPKYKTIIFVHGCYWHRHENCKFSYKPKSNISFWEEKFRNNLKRDKNVQEKLRALKWKVEIFWECETYKTEILEKRLLNLFTNKGDDC